MDDFLHNLRSGKLKQPDRSNRSYNDQQFKGGQRRPLMDRRKRDFDSNKDNQERLGVLKDVLENLADSQKRLAEAFEERNKTEKRKARAMEMLAKNIFRMLNPNAEDVDALFAPDTTSDEPPVQTTPENTASAPQDTGSISTPEEMTAEADRDEPVPLEEEMNAAEPEEAASEKKSSKLTILDQQTLYSMINRMREKGESWERIARNIADQGYPTLSGKGVWRGVMAKNLFEKMSS